MGWHSLHVFLNYTGTMPVVAPTDISQLVHKHCVIEHFCSVFCYFDYALSVIYGGMVIGSTPLSNYIFISNLVFFVLRYFIHE